MRPQERFQDALITLSNLSQHPARRLVDQVLFIPEERLRDRQGIFVLTIPEERERGKDRYPAFPEVVRPCEGIQRLPAPPLEMAPDDVRGGKVDQVPIIDSAGAPEVKGIDRGPTMLVRALVLADKDQKGEEPFLMERGSQQFPDLSERRVLEFPDGHPDIRHHDPQEPVAFPVLAGTGLEEPPEDPGFSRVRMHSKSALENACGHRLDRRTRYQTRISLKVI